jgi:hypothetical protein
MKSQVIENVTPLIANASYVSGTRDMMTVASDFGISISFFNVEVDSDQAGTIEIDESTDQIVWTQLLAPEGYVADTGILHVTAQPNERYVRAKYTNSVSAQTRFTMTTGVNSS